MLVVALATSHNVARDTTSPGGLQADRTPPVEAGGTNTAIVCDTTTYLPPEILRQLGIREVSLYVSLAGEQRAEAEIEDYDGERIRVYDSRSSAGGMGLVAIAAARAAEAGGSPDTVLDAARAARDALLMWFAIDTLEYLRRGGRIGPARAWLGSALKIKPILTLEEEITPIERVRTRRRAFERLVEYARERRADGADGWVVQHIQGPETARHLVEECRQIFEDEPVFVSEVGPVLGAHTGPGLIGVGGIPRAALG